MAPKRKASAIGATPTSAPKRPPAKLSARAAPKPRRAAAKRRRVLEEVSITAGGLIASPPQILRPGQIPPIYLLPTELRDKILESCDKITRICLALSHKELFFQLDAQSKWYKEQTPISQALYLNSRALGGGGRSLMLRMMLKGFIKGGSGMFRWIPGTRGVNTHEVVWNWHIQKFQKVRDKVVSDVVVKEYIDNIRECRKEKRERREERTREEVVREKGFRRERVQLLRAERVKKRDLMNCGDEDADTGESELDEGEVEGIEDELTERWPEVESDTESETGY